MPGRFALALLSLSGLAAPPALAGEGEAGAPAVASVAVSFKLDPRLAGPTYGGERWVSPPTYTGAAAQAAVEVRAFAVDSRGRVEAVDAAWASSDPETVAVSPLRGRQVTIVPRRTGEGSVTVKAGGASKRLAVRVVERNGLRQVIISQ